MSTKAGELHFGISLTAELTKFAALGASVAALEGVGRTRGWSELNGIVDGVVYGAAVGLGYAVGETFARELAVGVGPTEVSALTSLWTATLSCLSDGVFGAIIGAGIGAALVARSAAARALLPAAGLVLALLVHTGYTVFAQGGSLGSGGFVRAWIALLLPVALIIVVMVYGLAQERRAIADELADEAAGGAVTDDELERLMSPGARRGTYLRMLVRGEMTGLMALRSPPALEVLRLLGDLLEREGTHLLLNQILDRSAARILTLASAARLAVLG